MMKTAIQIFRVHCASIKRLIRANDVFGLIQKYVHRQDPVLLDLAKNVVNSEGVSAFADSREIYASDDEVREAEEGQSVLFACQQCVQSTYAALEKFLINKYWELIKARSIAPGKSEAKHFMGLTQLANIYKEDLNIELKSFDDDSIEINADDWFYADSPWRAIQRVRQAKNDIAHEGHSAHFEINQVEDAFYVHQFINQWVEAFDTSHE